MKIRIPKDVYDYFGSEAKLTVSVNKMSVYFNLEKFKKSLTNVSISDDETSLIEIDESELEHEALKDSKVFVILALYAMGVGE